MENELRLKSIQRALVEVCTVITSMEECDMSDSHTGMYNSLCDMENDLEEIELSIEKRIHLNKRGDGD